MYHSGFSTEHRFYFPTTARNTHTHCPFCQIIDVLLYCWRDRSCNKGREGWGKGVLEKVVIDLAVYCHPPNQLVIPGLRALLSHCLLHKHTVCDYHVRFILLCLFLFLY